MQTFTLKTRALPWASRALAKAAVGIAAEAICDRDLLYNLDLILSEACANVVRHAYKDQAPGEIEVSLAIEKGKKLEILVADWGVGFGKDPVDVANAHPEAEGGRGLFIMSELAEEFKIEQINGKNVIHVVMAVKDNQWTTS